MPSWFAVVTDHSLERTCSDRSGRVSLQNFAPQVRKRCHGPRRAAPLHTLEDSTGKITGAQAIQHGHLKIVGLVGSIDNGTSMTDLTTGAPTALRSGASLKRAAGEGGEGWI